MSNGLYTGIVEIRECGMYQANALLERGYRLIAVEQIAKGVERKPRENAPENDKYKSDFYVAKYLSYCFGRTAEQRPFSEVLDELKEARRAATAEVTA